MASEGCVCGGGGGGGGFNGKVLNGKFSFEETIFVDDQRYR